MFFLRYVKDFNLFQTLVEHHYCSGTFEITVGPDIGLNCLLMLSADDTGR